LNSQAEGDGLILKTFYFLENYNGPVTSNVVISEAHALMYVILNRAENHLP
jgi:hypothetical protein